MKTKKIDKKKINKTDILDTPILIAKRDIKAGETVEVKMIMGVDIYLESKDFKPYKIKK